MSGREHGGETYYEECERERENENTHNPLQWARMHGGLLPIVLRLSLEATSSPVS